ncbi:lytic transglycosylase domain-containing protein [Elioraea rosea]|uniref:lytic transglycosylase domain-containing protein n=1 Tax=Elioraea rosea TaxID=2492390 RepID=UPI0011839020|nr:lytic transglycosylase domain-containing protein [Elioraea rosea]
MASRQGVRGSSAATILRMLLCCVALGGLAACGGSGGNRAHYASGPRDYSPPGPPHDPWGPYIVEASQRYDVPEAWIREVMRVESAGRPMALSGAGAMGLMQVMPATYAELAERHGLGPDPYYPKDNILAGTAYIREMYERFGNPGFLAAYNGGPGTFDNYLAGRRGLPNETRNYVAKIAPQIAGTHPRYRADPVVYQMAAIPTNIPAGRRRPGAMPTQLASYSPPRPPPAPPTQVAAAPVRAPVREPVVVAATTRSPAPPSQGGFRLISSAHAAPSFGAPRPTALVGDWAIQVGAFQAEAQARSATEAARRAAPDILASARPDLRQVRTSSGTLTRARLAGLSADAAVAACQRLERANRTCVALSPDAQG